MFYLAYLYADFSKDQHIFAVNDNNKLRGHIRSMTDDMTALQIFAYNLEKIRKARKMSLKKLSQITGISYTYLTRTAKGEENISLNNMEKLAKALGVPLYVLLLPKDC